MTVNAITDTKKGRTGIAPTYLHTTPIQVYGDCSPHSNSHLSVRSCVRSCGQVVGTPQNIGTLFIFNTQTFYIINIVKYWKTKNTNFLFPNDKIP